jgi:tRNA (adenine37-N6)-methyltransferase
MKIELEPIGIIHTPFKNKTGIPIQGKLSSGNKGEIEIYSPYVDAMDDLNGFSRIYLIFYFHQSQQISHKVIPYKDIHERGVFATRAPVRPNLLGLTIVQLLEIQGNRIFIQGVDMLDKTPLLDIKPYVPAFDSFETGKIGWLSGKVEERRMDDFADDRFGE